MFPSPHFPAAPSAENFLFFAVTENAVCFLQKLSPIANSQRREIYLLFILQHFPLYVNHTTQEAAHNTAKLNFFICIWLVL
jgi:hypothetical protein